jgi:hypothetical protein
MSATKVFLWKNGKPLTNLDGVTLSIVDDETGEIKFKGADLAIFSQMMVLIPEKIPMEIKDDRIEDGEFTVIDKETKDDQSKGKPSTATEAGEAKGKVCSKDSKVNSGGKQEQEPMLVA